VLASPTVSDFSERDLIARIQQQLPAPPPWMVVGIGDDAAVTEPVRNQLDVFTVDAMVEGVHFDRRFMPAEAIGHRALAANLSDLAAMGATPRLALLSLSLPPDLPSRDFDAVIAGVAGLAATHRVHVAGGNLTRSTGPLVVDVTAIGAVKRRGILARRGARPGDDIYVTGSIGSARAGLQQLQHRSQHGREHTLVREQPAGEDALARSFLYPEPRVRAGVLLGRNRAATACIDLSDGLADGVHRIAEASGLGAAIEAGALPIAPDASRWFAERGTDPLMEALAGGDDYELAFTASPRLRGRLRAVARHGGVPLTRIGVCVAEASVRVRGLYEGHVIDAEVPQGFSHFR
jgi:thiamine-monophosphate kinase